MKKEDTYCKAIQESKTEEEVKVKVNQPREQPPGLVKPTKSITISTDDIANMHPKENPDLITSYFKEWKNYENTEKANNCSAIIE